MTDREALEASAPLAYAMAARSCRGCASYHGLWQYLRLLRVIEPMERHAPFFERELRAAKGSGRPRILVSGAADYWTCARVFAAFARRRAKPEVTVIDLCETPLSLNRWYARRLGERVATRRVDVLAFNSPAAFDAICSHAILGRFSPAKRKALAAKWYSLLRPGGRLITATPVRPGDAERPVRFTPQEAADFVSRVEQAAQRVRPGVGVAALLKHVRRHSERFRVYRVPSRESVEAMLEPAGFRLERLRTVAPVHRPGLCGPTQAGAVYLQIVARRP